MTRRALVLLLFAVSSRALHAQDTLPPMQGGYVRSLGLPAIYKPYLGAGIGFEKRSDGTHLTSQFRLGVFRDIGSPVREQLGWSLEYRAGLSDVRFDHGVRGLLVSNAFGIGAGVDFDFRTAKTSPLLTFISPVRRGGIFGGGSDLRLEWLPTGQNVVNLTVAFPLQQPHRGSTRAATDHVSLLDFPAEHKAPPGSHPELVNALAQMREAALWIDRLTVPWLGGSVGDPRRSAIAAVTPLKARLSDGGPSEPGQHTVQAEIAAYHAAMTRAFSVAVGPDSLSPANGTPLGRNVAVEAKSVLLEEVLFPYNRLLGQSKQGENTSEFARHARGVFTRWLLTSSGVPPGRFDSALYVFQQLLDVVEDARKLARKDWGDSRLVWLPLQLALEPQQYDEQDEVDTLVSHAVGSSLLKGNRLWYVHNDRFQLDLISSILDTRDYHVLWVHDFRGLTETGQPDLLSMLVTTHAYFTALRDRVREYDSTGHFPVYMIFLDQHYFEVNRSRLLLNLLQDPLGRRLDLPAGFDSLARAITTAQQELREAVAKSRLLQAERAQYGNAWLKKLVSVQVSVTNPADPSFRSMQVLPLIGVPDDIMRDHRKLVLYDVSEDGPYLGKAMYAGAGVGEHYVGPGWEDRAVILQGPSALKLRDEARELLEAQGIRGGEVPHVLRPRKKAVSYDSLVNAEIDSTDRMGLAATRALGLHNGTGFDIKEVSVAEATIFNLATPGSVLEVPDSQWFNELYASLLVGAGLRGARVLIIAPGDATAPTSAGGPLALIHDLLSRLLAVHDALAPELTRSGGVLGVGVYDADIGVSDLGERIRHLGQRLKTTPFLRELFGFDPGVTSLLDSAEVMLGTPPVLAAGPLPSRADSALRPKLHLKGFLYISSEPWRALVSGPPMVAGLREYLLQRARQVREGAEVGEDVMAHAMQQVGAAAINPVIDTLYASEKACTIGPVQCATRHWVFYLQIGSPNQDYRSMMMDGEAALLVSKWTSLYALPDFLLLTGLTAWPKNQAELDHLLKPRTGLTLRLAWWLRTVF